MLQFNSSSSKYFMQKWSLFITSKVIFVSKKIVLGIVLIIHKKKLYFKKKGTAKKFLYFLVKNEPRE